MSKIEKLAKIVKASIDVAAARSAERAAYDADASDEVMRELAANSQAAQEALDSLVDYGFNDYGNMQAIFNAAVGA